MIRRAWSAFLLLLLFTAAWPCGPFIPTLNLVVSRIPDGSREDWVAGRMGLLQPMLSTADLVVAWRWLSGAGMDAEEQKAMLGPGPVTWRGGGEEAWKKARAEAGASPRELRTGRAEDYRDVPVVGDHALALAAQTLKERIKTFGKGSAAVRSWLAAQDQVFAWEAKGLPEDAPANLPRLIQQDRAYQKAAALFYREDYVDAVEAFRTVAADEANAWRGWARFVLARIYAKVGSIAGCDLDAEQALAHLASLQADPAFAELHADAAALENRIHYQEDAPAFYGRLLKNLGAKHRGVALAQDMEDLRWLRVLEPWTAGLKDTKPAGVHAWIRLLQDGTLDETLAAYDAEPDLPHLVAVLLVLPKDHPRTEAFLKLAQQASLQPGPAYATLVSHRLRILVAQDRLQAAEALADEALARPEAARWPSAFNLWSAVKLARATDMDGFAAHLGRRLASIDDGWTDWSEHSDDGTEEPKGDPRLLKALDPMAVDLLNERMPLRLWESLFQSSRFPKELKAEFAETLWTRAAVLDREDVMFRHRAELARLRPKLAKELDAWAAEKHPARRRVLADLLIWEHRLWPKVLTFREEAFQFGTIFARWEGPPEPAPDPGPIPESGPDDRGLWNYGLRLAPAFLDHAADTEGRAEFLRIPAPLTWFCEQALAFAQAMPNDPLAPEALSRAVRSSRNGNRDVRSAELVVKAFRLLHGKYPNSPGARAAKIYH